MHMTRSLRLAALALAAVTASRAAGAQQGQQAVDSAYTRQIRELTPTDPRWKFTTELVDYLPASATVPTPLKVLGYVPGTVGRLSYVGDINRYFRALDDASTRVRIFSLGMSDEGREMLAVAIADDSVMQRLDEYRGMLARLADPRGLAPDERRRLVRTAKPVYWLTGSIHSPETGSPEMLMELGYRLAVDEGEQTRAIRANVVTVITPVLEVDGRDRVVDTYKLSKELKVGPLNVPLVYWGRYTAHDNNRDGMVLSQKLTQNYIKGFFFWHPVVGHDLHESVPFLYTSTGTGPYNEEFDPIVVNEWHQLAYQEINELTRRGLPGVWTHGFYDGWAPNYVLAIANLHNSIGRFYETYTSMGADCHTVRLPASATERRWDRTNPPVNGVRWCIRTNINYQQSGVLVALRHVADHRESFLENFAAKAERMIRRGQTTAPYAYVIPRGQHRAAEAADLVNLFRAHGAEVHVAGADFVLRGTGEGGRGTQATARGAGAPPRDTTISAAQRAASAAAPISPEATRPGSGATDTTRGESAPASPIPLPPSRAVRAGDWIVRMDQPYTATVRTLLSVQRYKPDDPSPYDDTGWTLDELRHVEAFEVADSSVLGRPMTLLAQDARVEGRTTGNGGTLLVRHLGDWRSAVLPWRARGATVAVAESAFTAGGASFPAGTFIVTEGRGGGSAVRDAVRDLGLEGVAVAEAPRVAQHPITLPRVALVHSWIETQNEGWVRFAFDQLGVPYTYLSDQSLRQPGRLDRFDVVVFPHVGGQGSTLLNGRPMVGPPIPWKKTALTPNLGRGPQNALDETDDIRPGMGLDGAAALRRFVERGGLLITEGATTRLPVDLGFNPTVSVPQPQRLQARGAVFRAQAMAPASPVLYGYERATFPVYFNQAPLLAVQPPDTANVRAEHVDPAIREQTERMRARVILRFHQRPDSLLISGLLVAGDEMAGRAAVVDAPVGNGHVLLFGIRPFWRWQSQGTFALALNAMANWNRLGTSPPSGPADRPRSVAAGEGR
jgi:hypothetical protein